MDMIMNDYSQFLAEIAETKAAIAKAEATVRRERSTTKIALYATLALIVAVVALLLTAPSEAQRAYFDVVEERYGMSQDTATEIATLWCDTGGNPDADRFANLIRTGTDEGGFDKLAGSRSELVLLTLAAERAYCPKS